MTWGDLVHPLINMTAIVVVRYLTVAATLHALLWRRAPARAVRLSRRTPTGAQVRGEIALSVGSSVIYAAPAAFAMQAWKMGGTRMYSDLSAADWPWLAAEALACEPALVIRVFTVGLL